MKRKGLCLMIALALGGAAVAAQAQDATMSTKYDGRWYITPTIGGYYNDTDRNTNSRQVYYGIGFGKFLSSNTSIDIFVDRTERDRDMGPGRHWVNNNIGVAARFYGGDWDAWRPYALAGILGSYHMDGAEHGWSPAAELGVGLSKTIDENSDFRVEAAYRYDWDNDSQPSENGYGDWLLGFSLVSRFGTPPAPPPPPAAPAPPPPPTCDQLDDDNDGVNNCVDKCPSSAAGSMVGPDGCPQKVVIDLRGVNFKFDRPSRGETDIGPTLKEPTSASMMILKQAVDTLKRYPKVAVKVVGYTDSIGAASYNQKLSERRAQIVYDYLTSHGISSSRLEGPLGHGENDPVASNDTKDGRARNRRVELKVDQAASGVPVEQSNDSSM